MIRLKIAPYLYLLLFGVTIAIIYHKVQPSNNFRASHLADANEYEKIYDYFKGNSSEYHIRFAIHNRIVIPFLASLLPYEKVTMNFFIVNTLFALLSLWTLYYLMERFNINRRYVIFAVIYFALHWTGPLRHNAISPVNVDIAVYFFETLFLLLFLKKKYWVLLLLSPLAIATKELFLAFLVIFLLIGIFWRIYFKDKGFSIPWIAGILLAGTITKLVLNHYFPSVSPGRNSVIVMAFHLREMFLNPDHILRWILSLFASFGAFILLIPLKLKELRSTDKDMMVVHILSFSCLMLSFLGGMDYTRLIFLSFPYLFISIIKLSTPRKNEMLAAFISSLVLTRFWKILPDPADDITLYSAWAPEVADIRYLLIWLFVAVFYFLIVLIANKMKSASTRNSHVSQ